MLGLQENRREAEAEKARQQEEEEAFVRILYWILAGILCLFLLYLVRII